MTHRWLEPRELIFLTWKLIVVSQQLALFCVDTSYFSSFVFVFVFVLFLVIQCHSSSGGGWGACLSRLRPCQPILRPSCRWKQVSFLFKSFKTFSDLGLHNFWAAKYFQIWNPPIHVQIHIEGHNSGSNFQISGYSETRVHQNDWILLSANLLSPHHHRLLVRKSTGVEFVSASFRVNIQDWVKFLSVSDMINKYY